MKRILNTIVLTFILGLFVILVFFAGHSYAEVYQVPMGDESALYSILETCANTSQGGTILLSGTYDINLDVYNELILPAGGHCSLVGDNNATSLFKSSPNNGSRGTVLLFRNSAGHNAIHMIGIGQRIEHLSIVTLNSDINTRAINCYDVGNFYINDVTIEGSNKKGIGLELNFCLKGSISNSNIVHYDNGIVIRAIPYDPDIDGKVGWQRSNANYISGTKIRANNTALFIDENGCRNLTLSGLTLEGNSIFGIHNTTHCHILDLGSHYENTGTNVLLDGIGSYTALNTRYGGPASGIGTDIVRTIDGETPDIIIHSGIGNGFTYEAGRLRLINPNILFSKSKIPTFIGNIYGDVGACEKSVRGSFCSDSNRLYLCVPINPSSLFCESDNDWRRIFSSIGKPKILD